MKRNIHIKGIGIVVMMCIGAQTMVGSIAERSFGGSVIQQFEKGAPLNIKNTAGKIPRDFAKEVGEKGIMELLEPSFATPTSRSTKVVANHTNGKKRKSPPSQEDVLSKEKTEYRGAFKVVQGKAPRIDATRIRSTTTLLFFPKRSSALQGKGQNGITSLHVAAQYGHTSILEMLLKGGMNKDIVDENGDTPLHRAVLFNREAIVIMLLKAGAKTEVVNKDGFTPLHLAAQNGWLAITERLLMANAKTEAVDKYGATPLHWAVLGDHEGVIEALLRAGARLDANDKGGITPLQLAQEKALQRLIVDGGAMIKLV